MLKKEDSTQVRRLSFAKAHQKYLQRKRRRHRFPTSPLADRVGDQGAGIDT